MARVLIPRRGRRENVCYDPGLYPWSACLTVVPIRGERTLFAGSLLATGPNPLTG